MRKHKRCKHAWELDPVDLTLDCSRCGAWSSGEPTAGAVELMFFSALRWSRRCMWRTCKAAVPHRFGRGFCWSHLDRVGAKLAAVQLERTGCLRNMRPASSWLEACALQIVRTEHGLPPSVRY